MHGRQQATPTLLDKNSFNLSKSCMKTEQQFLLTVKSRSKGMTPCRVDQCGFLAKCFSSGCETVCRVNAE